MTLTHFADMPASFDDAATLFKSVLTIIAIPIAYLQTRKTNYDRSISLLNEVATVILFRLHNRQFVARDEIKVLIKSKSLSKKINHKAIMLDDVMNKIVEKVEETPFISKIERRRILENSKLLREGKESSRLSFYIFIKNNEKDLISFIIFLSVILYLIFPPKNELINTIYNYKQFIKEIAISIFILVITTLSVKFITGILNPYINQGSIRLLSESYRKLPSFYSEILRLTGDKQTEYNLRLFEAKFDEKDKVVETDPGCLNLGIARFTKKHQSYNITFKTDNNITPSIELIFTINTFSAVNGMIDLDAIKYQIKKDNNETLSAAFPIPRNESGEIFIKERIMPEIDKNFKKMYFDKENVFVYSKDGCSLIINQNYKLIALEINGEILNIT